MNSRQYKSLFESWARWLFVIPLALIGGCGYRAIETRSSDTLGKLMIMELRKDWTKKLRAGTDQTKQWLQ